MARKLAGGRAGSPSVGALNVDPTAIVTAANNQDITIAPQGTAVLSVTNDVEIENQKVIRFADSDSSNWVGFRAPATVTSNVTWTLPATDSTGSRVLSSNGSGVLSWVDLASGGVALTDSGASSTVHYPIFGTNAGSILTGQITGFNNRSNLAFVPSTGTLNTTIFQAPDVIGSASASGTLTIRGTTNATKATASVLMTENVASTSSATGTLVVTGGVGVGDRINVAGSVGNPSTIANGLTISSGTLTVTSGSTSGILGFTRLTAGTALADADAFYIIDHTGPITLTLPATTTNGRTIVIADGADSFTNVITLARNGRNIAGVAEDLFINTRGSYVRLVYLTTGTDWKVYSF